MPYILLLTVPSKWNSGIRVYGRNSKMVKDSAILRANINFGHSAYIK